MTITTNPNAAANAAINPPRTELHQGEIMYQGQPVSIDQALELVFLDRANEFNSQAADQIKAMENSLNEMKSTRDMLARMKELQTTTKEDGGTSEMPKDMVEFLKARGVKTDRKGNDDVHNADEWAVNIQYLESYSDQVSGDNQVLFIKLKSATNKAKEAETAVSSHDNKAYQVANTILQQI